jgi:hypothetical protein
MRCPRPFSAILFQALAGSCALALVASPSLAGDSKRGTLNLSVVEAPLAKTALANRPRTAFAPAHTARFFDGVNMQMEAMSTFTATSRPGTAVQDNLMYAEHSQAVERSLVRTTRRAFRDYLMEVTAVNELIETYKNKGMRSVGLEQINGTRVGGQGRGRLGFDFGVSHFRPEVGVEYETGGSSFKLSVDSQGKAGFRYRNPRWGGNQVSVGFDGGEVYYVGWHVGGF